MLEAIGRDLTYASRTLLRSPAFALTAIVSLALGLGASLAVFTVADNVLLRPLPYRDSSRLVMLWEAGTKRSAGTRGDVANPGNFLDWRSGNDVLDGLAGMRESRSVLNDGDRAEELGKQGVTADFFPILGVQPIRGRLFTVDEDRPASAGGGLILISYRLWQIWFGGETSIIGRKVQIDSAPRTVIGVLPQGFHFLNREIDLWEPLGLNPAEDYRKSQGRVMYCVGRLRSGISLAQAQTRLTTLAARLEAAYPVFNKNWTIDVEPLRDFLSREVRTPLMVLLGAVAMMLLVACANVANLLLARYIVRRREIGMRVSLGAGRWRVSRQLLTESMLLSVVGGVAGILFARWGVDGLVKRAPGTLGDAIDIHFDVRVVGLAIALTTLTGLVFGILPALIASTLDPLQALRGDNRSGIGAGTSLRSWLVGAEVALSVVLLAGGLLLLRSLVRLETVNPGLDPSNMLTFRVSLPGGRYREASQRLRFVQQAISEIERVPGVHSASAVSYPPFSGHGTGTFVNFEGRPHSKPGEELLALVRGVMPGQFSTLRVPIGSGRDFDAADNVEMSPGRCVVNEAFVERFLPGEQPLGKKINLYLLEPENHFSEIIGVAGNLREWSMDRDPMPTVYYPYAHFSRSSMIFLVRGDRDAHYLAEPMRKIIHQLDPVQPIAEVRTMEDILGENYARQKFSAWLLSGFATVTVLLAAVGIYGLLAYSVTVRTREFGVRTALGADSRSIVKLVLASGARPVGGGLILGLAAALVMTRFLSSLLFRVGTHDFASFMIAPVLLALVAFLAAALPARRAAQSDPLEALRAE